MQFENRVGKKSVTPEVASDGPIARMMTVLGVVPPVIMNPPMATLSPVSTSTRVEMLSALPTAGDGVGLDSPLESDSVSGSAKAWELELASAHSSQT